MPKQPAGDSSKTPLVVALVIFILITLVLGYFTYDFNEQKTKALADAKAAADKEKSATEEKSKMRDAMLVYKTGLGLANDADVKELQGTRYKADAQKVHAEMMTAFQNKVTFAVNSASKQFVGNEKKLQLTPAQMFQWRWDATAETPPGAPAVGMVDMAVNAYSNRQLMASEYETQFKGMLDAIEQMKLLSKKLEESQQAVLLKQSQIPQEVGNQVKVFQDQFEKFKADFGVQSEKFRKDLSDKDEQIDKMTNLKKRADEKVQLIENSNRQLLGELESKVDPFQFDKPQGRILRRNGNIVEIDIGSADNLRQGLTFSVMPADTPQRGFEARMRQVREFGQVSMRIVPKGSIEVIETLGPNIAQCRVTGEESEVRDRVLAGDLIYNAVWRKGQSEHIALYGIFDVDGDGRDDIVAVVSELRKMGVVVDAYYDLGENKWKGEITTQTTLAVEGFSPSIGVAEGNREGKSRIISAITDARKLAKDKGIRVLRPRDFFPRIGYKARLDLSEDTINQAATFYIRSITADGSDLPVKKDGN
jgi:hypothetical protein